MGKWAKYEKHYNPEWEKEPKLKGWLRRVNDNSQLARCFCCDVTIRAHKGDLIKHAGTEKHLRNNTAIHPRQKTIINMLPQTEQSKVLDCKIAFHIAAHSSVNTVDHLGELLKNISEPNSILKSIRIHRTKCANIIVNVISPEIQAEMIKDIGTGYYSLIIDESTDVSVIKYLCIMVKYYSTKHKSLVVNVLALVEVTSATADVLFKCISQVLEEINLSIEKCIGIGTDGASNMVGKHHSVYTLMKVKAPHLILVKCVCHSLHLCCSKASKELPSNLEFLIRETHNWFKMSPLRRESFKKVFDLINTGNLKVHYKFVALSITRWLAFCNCVTVILRQWLELETHFRMASVSEHCYTARVLHEMFKDTTNKLYFIFLKPLLTEFQTANLMFQQSNADQYSVFSDLKMFVLTLLQRFVKQDALSQYGINVDLENTGFFLPMGKVDFGLEFKAACSSLQVDEQTAIKTRCFAFILTAAKEAQKRLPLTWDVFDCLKYFRPNICLSHINRPPFSSLPIGLAKQLGFDLDELEGQWRRLVAYSWEDILGEESTSAAIDPRHNTATFWGIVLTTKNALGECLFEELAQFVMALLTLPLSNATVERTFSQMNLIKTKLRNRMGLKALEAILRIRVGNQVANSCCQNFQPTNGMLKRFNSTMYVESVSREGDLQLAEFAAIHSALEKC